jgi:primosomal protein N'
VASYATVYPLVAARAVARAFTYEATDGVEKGTIVRVPFGRSRQRAVVVGVEDEAPPGIEPGTPRLPAEAP